MTQRYEGPKERARMEKGMCPECGCSPHEHTGLGGPMGCTLTDNGAFDRIAQYRTDMESSRHIR